MTDYYYVGALNCYCITSYSSWCRNFHQVKCWTPYWAQCNVCGGDFNFVMKLETMAQDQKFLTTVTNMKELKEVSAWCVHFPQ